MRKLGLKPRKMMKVGLKDASHLPYSSAEHQIELARRQLAEIPKWLYSGKRIDGSSF